MSGADVPADPDATVDAGAATGEDSAWSPEAPTPRSRYDEGIDLLNAAVDQVRHSRPVPTELAGQTTESRGRRRRGNGNGNGSGNGRGNGRGNGNRRGNGNGHGRVVAPPKTEGPEELEHELEHEEVAGADAETPIARRRAARARRTTAAPDAAEADDVYVNPAAPEELEQDEGAGTDAAAETPRARRRAARARRTTAAPEGLEHEEITGAEPLAPLDPVLVATAQAPSAEIPSPPRLTRLRQRGVGKPFLVVGLVVLLVAGALLLAGIVSDGSGGGGSSAPTDSTRTRLTFDAVPVADGATLERVWTLRGATGSDFVGRLTFSNSTDAAVTVSYTEVIPKSLASSTNDIVFDPEPVVLEADPVVRFDVTVPADSTVDATYRVDVPAAGTDRSRLEQWAEDLEAELARRSAETTTTTTTTSPTTTSAPPATTSPSPAGGKAPAPAPAPPPAPAPAPSGTIVIAARSNGGVGTFGFSGAGRSVTLTTAGSPDGTAQAAFGVSPGTYSWTEVSTSPGWSFEFLDCTDKEAGPYENRSTVSGPTATFNVQPGETVVCTWINRL